MQRLNSSAGTVLYFLTGETFMRILRLTSLSIVVFVGALPALAQSLPTKAAVAGSDHSPQAGTAPAFSWQQFASPQGTQDNAAFKYEARPQIQAPGAQQSSACYTLRDYLFYNKKSASAVPKLKDYSTCENASLFHELDVTSKKK
jgi:hypothetical protein